MGRIRRGRNNNRPAYKIDFKRWLALASTIYANHLSDTPGTLYKFIKITFSCFLSFLKSLEGDSLWIF